MHPLLEQPEAGKLLVVLLARERRLWAPLRAADWQRGPGPLELRTLYRQKGLRWLAGGSQSNRKAAEQASATSRPLAASKRRQYARPLPATDRQRPMGSVRAGR